MMFENKQDFAVPYSALKMFLPFVIIRRYLSSLKYVLYTVL